MTMTIAMFATIWVALALFVAGELGKPGPSARRRASATSQASSPGRADAPASVAWRLWTAGAILAAVHIPIAFATQYAWSHAAAEQETARRTGEMFGLDWGGGVFVNYVFVAAWLAEAAWWRVAPAGYARRSAWIAGTLRIFYLVVIVSAAVVFASPAGRWPGVAIVVALMWIWRPRSRAIA